jgi:hypothetical protein
MVIELQRVGRTSFSVQPETDEYGLRSLFQSNGFPFPDNTEIMVEELEPNLGGLTLEHLLELHSDTTWEREPMWQRNTVVEFGFFPQRDGHELIRINGQLSAARWPGWYFTRWQALSAFRTWVSFIKRSFGLRDGLKAPAGVGRNEFVLLRETDRVFCNDAGRHLAAVMQSCCNEGTTAPGVTVLYVETDLQCAASI